jgi:deazaflavin-dependent oxidoreductase (nitroreductase family)
MQQLTAVRAADLGDREVVALAVADLGGRSFRHRPRVSQALMASRMSHSCPPGDDLVADQASKAGAPRHPAWFHNLRANPSVTVELGGGSFQATAVVTEGEERDRLYAAVSGVTQYAENTDRVFPVIVLDGVPAPA